jgi:hypothetical protein
MTFKISKDNIVYYSNFDSLTDCETWVLANLGSDCIVQVSDEQVPLASLEERLNSDLNFGDSLIREFLIDNRIANVSSTDSITVAQKFKDIELLARNGDIRTVKIVLESTAIDVIFTQDRKDKYLTMITTYLASR